MAIWFTSSWSFDAYCIFRKSSPLAAYSTHAVIAFCSPHVTLLTLHVTFCTTRRTAFLCVNAWRVCRVVLLSPKVGEDCESLSVQVESTAVAFLVTEKRGQAAGTKKTLLLRTTKKKTPRVCVSEIIESPAVSGHNKPKTKNQRTCVSPGMRASPSTCRVFISDGPYSSSGRWCTFGRTAGRATWPERICPNTGGEIKIFGFYNKKQRIKENPRSREPGSQVFRPGIFPVFKNVPFSG